MATVDFAPAARQAAAEGVWHRLEARTFRIRQRSRSSRFEAVPDAASLTIGVRHLPVRARPSQPSPASWRGRGDARHLGFPVAILSNPLKEMT